MVTESILDSIKIMLGNSVDDTNFDAELIMFINGALAIINKLGVGLTGYKISNNSNTWDEFLGDRTDLEEVKTNVYLRVRLAFDPPQNSFLVTSIKEQIVESTWYIELYHKENTTVGEGETPDGE